MAAPENIFTDIEAVFERLLVQQRDKVVEVALDILPHLTPQDVQNPQDYPEVAGDTMFNYEDGFLAGLISARQAIRSIVFAAYRASSSPAGRAV